MQDYCNLLGSAVVVLCGFLLGSNYSSDIFGQTVAVSGSPTPVQDLVRRWPFAIGRLAVVGFCLLTYIFVLAFYHELPALVDLMPGAAKLALDGYVNAINNKSHPSLLAVTVAVTAGFLYAVRNDFPGSVLYRFRALVYATISVTHAYDRIHERLLNSSNVPHAERGSASRPRISVCQPPTSTGSGRSWPICAAGKRRPARPATTSSPTTISISTARTISSLRFASWHAIAEPGGRTPCAAMAAIQEELREQYAAPKRLPTLVAAR